MPKIKIGEGTPGCIVKGCYNESEEYKAPSHYANSEGYRYFRNKCTTHLDVIRKNANQERRNKLADRFMNEHGYVVYRPGLPAKAMPILEHRYVMEQMLGRKLTKGESVHHINGIRHDNRPENLELWVGPIRYGQRASDITCSSCGAPYKVEDKALQAILK